MSAQQTESISQAAQRAWRGSLTEQPYEQWLERQKAVLGFYWGSL